MNISFYGAIESLYTIVIGPWMSRKKCGSRFPGPLTLPTHTERALSITGARLLISPWKPLVVVLWIWALSTIISEGRHISIIMIFPRTYSQIEDCCLKECGNLDFPPSARSGGILAFEGVADSKF